MILAFPIAVLAGDDQVAGTFAGAAVFNDLLTLEQKDFPRARA